MKEAVMKRARAFTLVEILIVVVLLGILAAIVIPALAGGTTLARQSTLAMNLNLLRRLIPVYASQHLEVAPGYPNGDRSAAPTEQAFVDQATLSSNKNGQTATRGTAGFPLGPYVSNVPPNPFNKLATVTGPRRWGCISSRSGRRFWLDLQTGHRRASAQQHGCRPEREAVL